MDKFTALGLEPWIIKCLEAKGFKEPSPIQEQAIPVLLAQDHDIIGQAQTGTGKTAAFGLPIVQKIEPGLNKPQALILCPTRELALQVNEEIKTYCKGRGITTVTLYGGAPIMDQQRALKKGVDLVVATPGRCIHFIENGKLDLTGLKYLVLDEADEMLNMGFVEDVEKVLKASPDDRTILMFSATMPPRLKKIAESYMKNSITIKAKSETMTMETIDQVVYEAYPENKFSALCRIMDLEKDFYGIIFCRTKVEVEKVAAGLKNDGYSADYIHGDVAQESRERLLKRFRNRNISLLIATDVAARGIDVTDLSHIVNYSLPEQFESYVHRIGRTGRAGKKGTAITLITPKERSKMSFIEKKTNAKTTRLKLPFGDDMIKLRIQKLSKELTHFQENNAELESLAPVKDVVAQLLEENAPVDIITALLSKMFGNKLDAGNYPDINCSAAKKKTRDSRTFSGNTNSGDTKSLFFAMGKRDGMMSKKVISFICDKSKVSPRGIDNLKVFDKFSLFTTNEKDAERIIRSCNRKGKSPVVRFDRD